jgi:hypothetical protein
MRVQSLESVVLLQIGTSCVMHHPTQRHIVFAGGQDGSLTVWDLRHNTFPVTLLNAHSDTGTVVQVGIS